MILSEYKKEEPILTIMAGKIASLANPDEERARITSASIICLQYLPE